MGKELDLFEALKAMEEGKKVVCLYKLGGEDHYYFKSLDGNYFVHVDDRNLYVGEFPANAKFKIYTGKNDDKTIIENEDFEITFKDKIDYYSAKEFFIETYLHMKEMTSGYVLKSESFTMKLKSDLTDELVEYAIEDVLTSLTDELFKKYATVVYRDRGGLAK